MGRSQWTREQVLEEIRLRHAANQSLGHSCMMKENARLVMAAQRLFGSWGQAVETAGIDYQVLKRQIKDHSVATRKPRGYWSPERIRNLLQERLAVGKSINHQAVFGDDPSLLASAVKIFGSYERAVEQCTGLPYKQVRLTEAWSKEKIVQMIQNLKAAGVSLASRSVMLSYPDLFAAGNLHFGTWKAAVEAAGLSFLEEQRRDRWTPEKVKQVLRAWAASNSRGLPQSVGDYVRRHFDSWESALTWAGLDPSLAWTRRKRRPAPWTSKSVIEAIRQRARDGQSLSQTVVKKEYSGLLYGAARCFGSWVKAKEAALDPKASLFEADEESEQCGHP